MFKRIILMAVGAALALSVGAAGAYFTAQVKVSDSMIEAGTVAISTVPTTTPLAIKGLAPGRSMTRSLQVLNDGTLASDIIVTASRQSGITDFHNVLRCKVSHAGTSLYDGPLSGLRTVPTRLAGGESRDLSFEISMPATATDYFQGDYTKVSLAIDAEQAH